MYLLSLCFEQPLFSLCSAFGQPLVSLWSAFGQPLVSRTRGNNHLLSNIT
jgi:hypothetical protein